MNAIKKHIVFLIPGFPENEKDVNCIPILQTYILYYQRENAEVKISVIAFQYPFKQRNYKWNGINVYAIGGANRRGIHRISTWLKVALCFRKLHKGNKVSVIHSFWLTQCALVGQYIANIFKIKHISTIAGQDPLPSNKYLSYINFSKTTLVSLSDFAAEKFKETTGKKVQHVISIGLDVENFRKAPSDSPKTDILGVGNLHSVKNYRLFIEIVEELVISFPNVKCKIVGTGEDLEMLRNMIIEKKLPGNIELTNELPRYKVLELMADSKIFLHPSLHEGQGYVFAEALYAGMSIVAFKVGNLIPSERIATCENKEEMIERLKFYLNNKLNRKQILIQSMKDTIEKFNTIYFT